MEFVNANKVYRKSGRSPNDGFPSINGRTKRFTHIHEPDPLSHKQVEGWADTTALHP
jgi:hypothetical protein